MTDLATEENGLPDINRASVGSARETSTAADKLSLPLPILKKHHPASTANSTRASSPPKSAAGDTFAAHMVDSTYSPVAPSPLRAATSVGLEQANTVTFSEPMTPASPSPHMTTQPITALPHGILKTTSQPSSRRNSVSDGDVNADASLAVADTNPQKLNAALLQLPGTETSSRRSSTARETSARRMRSASPSADRSRTVGKGGYGGRRGGPSMLKSQTSSSGGLSDIDMQPGYERKVGFDTMVDAEDTPNGYFTFCLQVKSIGYRRTKNTRTFMCAVDDNAHSERALEWLMESLVSDGDEVVATRIIENRHDIDQESIRDEARELMASIVDYNDEVGHQAISIVVEFIALNDTLTITKTITSTILGLIYMYRPDSLTVGTRGKNVSAFQRMVGTASMGSISRELLNRCPVPLVIVRPEFKVKKHLAKRQNDPKRRSYHDLVALGKDDNLPLSVGASKRSNHLITRALPFHHREDR